jgi:hypothetical protein
VIDHVGMDSGPGGLITYLDDNFNPVDPDKATLVKIRSDDGEVVFARPVDGAQKRETAGSHCRDESGPARLDWPEGVGLKRRPTAAKEESGSGEAETVQLAVPIPRRWRAMSMCWWCSQTKIKRV